MPASLGRHVRTARRGITHHIAQRLLVGGVLAIVLAGPSLRGGALAHPAVAASNHTSSLRAPTVTRRDGAQLVLPTIGQFSAQNPAFSPDGQTLIFTLYYHGYDATLGPGGGVFALPVSGGRPRPVYPYSEATNVNGLASWNGAVNRIAFAVSTAHGNIVIAAPDGSNAVTVARAPAGHSYLEPTFSHDGTWIAFEDDSPAGAPDAFVKASLWKVHLDGSHLTQLVDGPGTNTDNRLPVWSPDGTKILFQRRLHASSGTGFYDLYTVQPDGSGLMQLTHGNNGDSDASWSPDGRWILDSAYYGNLLHPNIFLVSADGQHVVRVTRDAYREDGAPAMSLDGQWIYFESHRTANESSEAELWRIRAPLRLPA